MPTDLDQLQATLRQRRARWTARQTPQSLLSDQQKRALCGVIVDQVDLAAIKASHRAGFPEPHFDQEVDWRNRNGNHVSPIKDQGQCGSCVSFSCCAMVESMASIELGRLPDLSEADLHFGPEHGATCRGWNPSDALRVIRTRGVVDESIFPYMSAFGDPPTWDQYDYWLWRAYSRNVPRDFIVRITENTTLSSVVERKNYLTHVGPCVGVMHIYDDFFYYGGGIYEHLVGRDTNTYHAIDVIGYSEAEQCWICKNSWGTGWGDAGFFRIAYGECEIDTFPFWTARDVRSLSLVPHLGKLSPKEALSRLRQADLWMTEIDHKAPHVEIPIVTNQNPRSGIYAPRGSIVEVYVAVPIYPLP